MKLRHLPVLFGLLLPMAAFGQNAAIQTASDRIKLSVDLYL